MRLQIETLRLLNFKALQDVTIRNIPRLAIFVGANGVGKSTLFSVFAFLKECLVSNVAKAVQMYGGYRELVSRGHESENILIEIQYRMPIAGRERLVTYHLEFGPDEKKRISVKSEYLSYKRAAYGSPFHFMDFKEGRGYAISNESDFSKPDTELQREKQDLGATDILALKGLGQFSRFTAANEFRKMIEGWHVSDFHIEAARGSKDMSADAEHLNKNGDNLQNVANAIREQYPEVFQKILDKMKSRVPGIGSIRSEITQDNRLLLEFQDSSFKDPFIDKYVSDGTLKMFAYLVLLNDPAPHPLLCIEEPENQLYPHLLDELVEEFREYTGRGGQVFVSTHSPALLNAAEVGEVFWFRKQNGYSEIFRASDNEQIVAYMKDGDKMGYLWNQGLFTGADPS
ncbi:MAG: AAA family ATPase [Treponema sp.]|nr:AAA family ATPase [Treponema sp.]